MTAPDAGYAPDPAAIVSAADVLRTHMQREAPDVAALMFNADFEGLAMALDEAGRLLPADAETRTEWGTRLAWDDGPVEDLESSNLAAAQGRVGMHARQRAERPGWRATAALIQRTHWVGPWLPAPTNTEESA